MGQFWRAPKARILNVSPWVRIVSPTRSSDPFQFHETTVLWESSVVVRQALIKAYGPGSVQQYGEAYYVISVSFFPVASGAPPYSHANSAEELAEELLELCRAIFRNNRPSALSRIDPLLLAKNDPGILN